MDYAIEVGGAGPSGVSQIPGWESSLNHTTDVTSHSTVVNLFTASHDRNWPLSKHSSHCLETHTGSHLEVDETDPPDNKVISHSAIVHSSTVFHDSTRPIQKIQATVWKLMQDLSWKMLIQLCIYYGLEFKYSESTYSHSVIPENTYIS